MESFVLSGTTVGRSTREIGFLRGDLDGLTIISWREGNLDSFGHVASNAINGVHAEIDLLDKTLGGATERTHAAGIC
jgi:hypothetical protein